MGAGNVRGMSGELVTIIALHRRERPPPSAPVSELQRARERGRAAGAIRAINLLPLRPGAKMQNWIRLKGPSGGGLDMKKSAVGRA